MFNLFKPKTQEQKIEQLFLNLTKFQERINALKKLEQGIETFQKGYKSTPDEKQRRQFYKDTITLSKNLQKELKKFKQEFDPYFDKKNQESMRENLDLIANINPKYPNYNQFTSQVKAISQLYVDISQEIRKKESNSALLEETFTTKLKNFITITALIVTVGAVGTHMIEKASQVQQQPQVQEKIQKVEQLKQKQSEHLKQMKFNPPWN